MRVVKLIHCLRSSEEETREIRSGWAVGAPVRYFQKCASRKLDLCLYACCLYYKRTDRRTQEHVVRWIIPMELRSRRYKVTICDHFYKTKMMEYYFGTPMWIPNDNQVLMFFRRQYCTSI